MVPQDILLEKSLVDCHCLGMDSLVIKGPPNMVRMFIARPDHQLWRNSISHNETLSSRYDFSVALHRHHCDVTLMPILGSVVNVTPATCSPAATVPMRSFKYFSPITDEEGEGGFESVDPHPIPIGLNERLIEAPLYMKAAQLHTVYVPRGQVAAWFFWEGAENRNHNSIVYSNADLTNFDFSVLDKPMTMTRLREDLAIIGVR